MSTPPKPSSQDSAHALLSGILDDTAASARAEEAAHARLLDARRRAEADAQARRDADVDAQRAQRLQAQRDHQRHAHQTRASLVRAFDGPSLEEALAQQRAEAQAQRAADLERQLADAERARLDAEQRAADAERDERAKRAAAALRAQEAAAALRAHTLRSRLLAAAFALVALALGLGAAWTAQSNPDAPLLQASYAKHTLTAASIASPAIDYGFKRIPAAADTPATTPADDAAKPNTVRRPWHKRGGNTNTTTQPNFDFGGSDSIFKKGP